MLYVVRSIETVVAADPMMVKDTFYISHGAPMLATNESLPASQFFRSWREKVYSQRPKSILMISAHWDTSVPTVNVVDQLNDTIHDFNEIIRSIPGFSEDLYELRYPAPGAPELAKRVKEVLLASGFERVDEERNRGLDQSAWVPLMMMYPDADIPVCQLSLQLEKDGTYHYNLGKALAPLREEGVVIIGSGNTTHNVNSRKHYDGTIAPWASAFDTWLRDALLEGRYEDVNQYEEKASNPKMAHPSPDHFYPLHVAMGAASENAKAELIHQSWSLGTLSYSSYKFTAAN